jgi:hypothetical protein
VPFKFIEQGPGLVAVVDVLEKSFTDFPGSGILGKWVDDLTNTAMSQYKEMGETVHHFQILAWK